MWWLCCPCRIDVGSFANSSRLRCSFCDSNFASCHRVRAVFVAIDGAFVYFLHSFRRRQGLCLIKTLAPESHYAARAWLPLMLFRRNGATEQQRLCGSSVFPIGKRGSLPCERADGGFVPSNNRCISQHRSVNWHLLFFIDMSIRLIDCQLTKNCQLITMSWFWCKAKKIIINQQNRQKTIKRAANKASNKHESMIKMSYIYLLNLKSIYRNYFQKSPLCHWHFFFFFLILMWSIDTFFINWQLQPIIINSRSFALHAILSWVSFHPEWLLIMFTFMRTQGGWCVPVSASCSHRTGTTSTEPVGSVDTRPSHRSQGAFSSLVTPPKAAEKCRKQLWRLTCNCQFKKKQGGWLKEKAATKKRASTRKEPVHIVTIVKRESSFQDRPT
jgi:hypothetical protein